MIKHEYKTGDIIHATSAPPTTGILSHHGVIVVEKDIPYIYHNTPMQKNDKGGSTVKDTLKDFVAAKRRIRKIERSKLTKDEIEKKYDFIEHRKFKWLSWNCEHFVHYMRYDNVTSPQLNKVAVVSFFLVSIYIITRPIFKKENA